MDSRKEEQSTMRRKLFLTVVMTTMLALTACGNTEKETEKDRKETSVEEDDEKESKENKRDSKKDDKEDNKKDDKKENGIKQEKEPRQEPEINDNGGIAILNEIFDIDIQLDEESTQYFDQMDGSIGYLTDDVYELEMMMEYMGLPVEELSRENMDADEQALFRFAMYNQDTAQLVQTGESESYATQVFYNDELFYVLFGSDEADAEEVENFCQEGTTLEYWAIGMVQDDDYLLVPLFAGNEENGYYLVRPALISSGYDMSGILSLVDVGIDFTTDSYSGNGGSDNVITELTGEESIAIEITDIESESGTLIVYYEITNTYPFNAFIGDESFILNGEDITDSVVSYIVVDANDSMEDYFFIDNQELVAGDELVLNGMLFNDDTYDEIGEIEFVFNLE